MLTALAITWFFSEIAFRHPSDGVTSSIFLIIFAFILDLGIWTLGDS